MEKKTSLFSGALVFLVLLTAVPLAAQNSALVGTVTDPQQSAVECHRHPNQYWNRRQPDDQD